MFEKQGTVPVDKEWLMVDKKNGVSWSRCSRKISLEIKTWCLFQKLEDRQQSQGKVFWTIKSSCDCSLMLFVFFHLIFKTSGNWSSGVVLGKFLHWSVIRSTIGSKFLSEGHWLVKWISAATIRRLGSSLWFTNVFLWTNKLFFYCGSALRNVSFTSCRSRTEEIQWRIKSEFISFVCMRPKDIHRGYVLVKSSNKKFKIFKVAIRFWKQCVILIILSRE